jgi:hypothetical protein
VAANEKLSDDDSPVTNVYLTTHDHAPESSLKSEPTRNHFDTHFELLRTNQR